MIIRKSARWQLSADAVTPETLFLNRRRIIKAAGAIGVGALVAGCGPTESGAQTREGAPAEGEDLRFAGSDYSVDDPLTPYDAVTTYNNYYEFGLDKGDPARNAHTLTIDPWSVTVEGHANRTGEFALADLIDFDALEERIYRLRCVEAWSMVIPWVGVPLGPVLAALQPTAQANYVQFETVLRPEEMPGVRQRVLDWPYVEGLRMDEAMNDLAFLAVGLYGKALPRQNGAPIRLVVPWKYGFKSIKSISAIRFVEDQPMTSWNEATPREYGFYSNVNPEVSHPRWSQATERVIGGSGLGALIARRETEMFNGYEAEVASLYEGMDLRANY
jgi:sulfoxide reductase catalytic subunit YedY